MNKLQEVLLFLVFFVVALFIFNKIINHHEIKECYKWQEENTDHVNWRIEQCNHHNINI
jgi:hypothetical protein